MEAMKDGGNREETKKSGNEAQSVFASALIFGEFSSVTSTGGILKTDLLLSHFYNLFSDFDTFLRVAVERRKYSYFKKWKYSFEKNPQITQIS